MDKVSIVIPSILDELPEEITSELRNQTVPIHEIIVVKDSDRRGPAWARNHGIERSTGDWVAFIDDDCIPRKDWIESLLIACNSFEASVAGGSYIESDPLLNDLRNKKNYPKVAVIDEIGIVGAGGNIMFARKTIDDCISKDGYFFNETYELPSAEDHELIWRLRSQGAKIVFVPIYHKHLKRVNLSSYLKMKYIRGKGIAWLHDGIKKGQLVPVQESKLWSKQKNKGLLSNVATGIHSLIGPFDFRNFSSFRNFFYYWIGEKYRMIGFLSEKLKWIRK